MRKFFKYLLGVIGVIFLLPFLIVFLLYLPPVQDFVKNKTVDYLEKNQGMVVKVGYFRLGFPLDLAVEDVYVGKTATDTLAAVGKLHLKVGLGEIFQQRLAVEELVLEHVKFGLSNDTTGMRLDVDVENLELAARKVDLKDRWVDVAFIRLAGGEIAMDAGRTVEEDTTVSAPLDWLISVDRVDLQEVAYRMSTGTMPSLHAGIAAGSLVGSEVALEGQTVDMDSLSVSGAWCKIVAAGGIRQRWRQCLRIRQRLCLGRYGSIRWVWKTACSVWGRKESSRRSSLYRESE